ncbi:MAG: hypothetical protein ACRYFS_26675 [Janthinobacterium lividum]
MSIEAIGIIFAILFWVISTLIKGFKRLLNQTGGTPPLIQAPPPSQPVPAPIQTLPPRVPLREPVRTAARQPSAGGPAVTNETTRRDFQRQEQALEASEPAGLNTSLLAGASSPTAQPNRLFGGTDDLVRAIILQEVLGPPLSRRKPAPVHTPQLPQ